MVRDGKGKCKYINKDIYDGNWNDGVREGQGKLTLPNGYYYEGDWVDD